ncbi:MAG TPA: hypothetical protein VIN08_01760 [Ohtaekwangia sp.]|uniref:hypothetical protein n=1 Tax=Ohtaekwangia sp. TaxID=2066019 RepID=UPI002F95D93D
MTQKTSSDEIDLMELLAKLYRTVKRNILIFIILPAIGVIIALWLAYNSSDKFSSSMMITTNLLSANEARFIFDELGRADSIPGLTKDEENKLLVMNFEVQQDNIDEKEAIRNIYVKATAVVTDPSIFPALEKTIVGYLNSVDPLVETRRDRELFYKQMIQKIDSEIASMDQIKKQTDSRVMASYIDPSDLYAKTVELFKERTENEIQLRDIETVHVTKGFGTLMKDAKLPKILVALSGFGVGLLLAIVLMFVKFFNDYNRALKLD